MNDFLLKFWENDGNILPEDGTYVLIYVPDRPWSDRHDKFDTRYFRVAKFVGGLSEDERKSLPDTDERKITFCGEDEWGNNRKPYKWEEFGPDSHFGQDPTHWAYLPDMSNRELMND